MRRCLILGILMACGAEPEPEPSFGLESRSLNADCHAFARPSATGSAALEQVYNNLAMSQPIALERLPGDASRWYVAEKAGRISHFENRADVGFTELAMDIRDRVDDSSNEMGLLGLAFHPEFASNGYAYVNYTSSDSGSRETRISRFSSVDDGASFDPDSEEILLRFDQPYGNHNGGDLAFGADGYLYIAVGDGGSGGDPLGHGQNTDTLLGSILRIDVDGGPPYQIPATNPFAGGGGAPEIFAWGMRNPWRMSFDRFTGELWTGDVGQNAWEEIDRVVVGGNYGWRGREGTHCYDTSICDDPSYIDPVVEYPHSEGSSVTGGFVYRGEALPWLEGVYLFTDFYTDDIRGVFFDEESENAEIRDVVPGGSGSYFSTFGQGADGELYLVSYAGAIYKLVPEGENSEEQGPPARLSQTGCMQDGNPALPGPALVPYGVNLPLWSDGLEKARYMAIPDGETVGLDAQGALVFPVGSVLVKSFYDGERLLETRFLVRHEDGDWGGYSYLWNEEIEDGVLVMGGSTISLDSFTWTVPSSADCQRCHVQEGQRALGMQIAQLNRPFEYPGGVQSDQLETLAHIGWFEEPLPASMETLPSLDGTDSPEEKARAYLHVQCAHCHGLSSNPTVSLDLRRTISMAEMGVCDVEPEGDDMGVEGAMLLSPGSPERSVLSLRMAATDGTRMPELGSRVIHTEGLGTVDDWIRSLEGCTE